VAFVAAALPFLLAALSQPLASVGHHEGCHWTAPDAPSPVAPATIVDSAGRTIRVESDQAGRVARVLVPAPAAESFVEYIRYDYSPEGDLIAATDVLGRAMRMAYERHLMVKETKRSGLSFHFAYEGRGNDACCIATWGDGGIYKRRLIYDTNNHTTIVSDSRDADTIYQMNADNAVVSVMDALGAVTKYDFDDCYNKVAETDPLDRTTKWAFDERGNCTKIVHPDGAEVSLFCDERNSVIRAVDPIKGEWRWDYDRSGCLLAVHSQIEGGNSGPRTRASLRHRILAGA
jgi:YD repeat-containing protein